MDGKNWMAEENLLSDSDVAKLKIKVGKGHRTEKDWDFIRLPIIIKWMYILIVRWNLTGGSLHMIGKKR